MLLHRIALTSAVVAALSVVTVLCVWGLTTLRGDPVPLAGDGSRSPGAGVSTVATDERGDAATRDHVAALGVLRAWDERRAAAWASGDTVALAGLYVPSSRTGRRDVAMLEQYVTRGLRVVDMQTQLLAVDVRELGTTRVVVDVTDRVAGAVAVGRGVRRPLPADAATTRRVELRRQDGVWRVREVRRVSAQP